MGEDFRNVLGMFGQAPGVNKVVVYVDEDTFMEELPEYLMHEVLEYGGGVDQPICITRYS